MADYVHMKDLVGDRGLSTDYSFYSYLYFNYFYSNEDVPNFARRGWRINLRGKCMLYEGANNDGTLTTVGSQPSFLVNGSIVKAFAIGKKNSVTSSRRECA